MASRTARSLADLPSPGHDRKPLNFRSGNGRTGALGFGVRVAGVFLVRLAVLVRGAVLPVGTNSDSVGWVGELPGEMPVFGARCVEVGHSKTSTRRQASILEPEVPAGGIFLRSFPAPSRLGT